METKNSVCVYLEVVAGKLSQVSQELLGKGRQLADSRQVPLLGLLLGGKVENIAQCAIGFGANKVVVAEDAALAEFNAALYTKAVAQLVEKYAPNVVLIGASKNGRDLGGRLSALLNLGLVADCTECSYAEADSDAITWIRPAFTGKLFVRILTTTRPQLATISNKIFRGNVFEAQRQGEVIRETVTLDNSVSTQRVVNFAPLSEVKQALSLESAEIVVGAGRGVEDPEGLKKVEAFAAEIGAALGVSKPVVDNGWAPYEMQVGVTGKKIAPKIYLALGISGAIQHQMGIKEAGTIIAVNSDPTAPIFQFAHYGIVGDLFAALPVLAAEIKKIRG